jgi:mannose-6-phosphate isomerase class I
LDRAFEVVENVSGQGAWMISVRAGEVYIVPAGHLHAVARGSQGTLAIVDR